MKKFIGRVAWHMFELGLLKARVIVADDYHSFNGEELLTFQQYEEIQDNPFVWVQSWMGFAPGWK